MTSITSLETVQHEGSQLDTVTDLSLCVIVRRLLALHAEATQETADASHLTLTQFASIMEAVRGVHDGGDARVPKFHRSNLKFQRRGSR